MGAQALGRSLQLGKTYITCLMMVGKPRASAGLIIRDNTAMRGTVAACLGARVSHDVTLDGQGICFKE